MATDLSDPYLLFILASFPSNIVFIFVIILILLLCSALISGSEIAFFSLDPNDIKSLQEEGSSKSRKILTLKQKPRRLLATILIANNFINIAIVLLSNSVSAIIFPKKIFVILAESIDDISSIFNWRINIDGTADVIQFLITVIGVTFFLVVFGEIVPKIYANINNIKLAKLMSRPLTFLSIIFAPINNLLVNWSIKMESKLVKDRSAAIKEDIDHAIELTVRNDESTEEEVDILKSIVKFSDVTVKQVMRSRTDVIAVEDNTNYEELLNLVKKSGFSRIPVYHEDFDNLVGILYIKDLLGHLNENPDFKWQEFLHNEILYTPESKKINELLKEIQLKRTHMAIVVDEYGGSAGIITLEDIMEEVIGDIKDEFDEEEVDYIKIDARNYIFDGKILLNDVSRIVGIDIESLDNLRGDADSLAGLILEQTGVIPRVNRLIKLPNVTLKILSVNKRRIEKIQLIHEE